MRVQQSWGAGVRWWIALAGLVAGCAHTGPAGEAAATIPLGAFLPLAVGNQWVYGTTFQEQAQPDLTVEIVREEGGYFLDNRPSPSRLAFDGEGLRDGTKRYLLKGPLKEGERWMCVADVKTVERYEIVGVERKVQVPAGVFPGCVTVRMEVRMSEERAMLNDMTFAPGVGIIEIRTSLKDGSRILPQSRMELKRYELKPAAQSQS